MNKTTKNLLLCLKNSSIVKLNEFYCNHSKKNIKLLQSLYVNGLIQSYIFSSENNKIKIILRYTDNKPIFSQLKFVSTTLKCKVITFKELTFLFNRRFILFVNTNLGIKTINECRNSRIGGKMLFIC
jgi:ribosomal protein S8